MAKQNAMDSQLSMDSGQLGWDQNDGTRITH